MISVLSFGYLYPKTILKTNLMTMESAMWLVIDQPHGWLHDQTPDKD